MANVLLLGKFKIMDVGNGNVWIQHEDGEGGEFPVKTLESAVEKYFWDNF